MPVLEIVRSCSNHKVAEAATKSIGRGFFESAQGWAHVRGMNVGQFAAHCVSEFQQHASEDERKDFHRAVTGVDMPILTGLRFMIEAMANRAKLSGRLNEDRSGHAIDGRRDVLRYAAAI